MSLLPTVLCFFLLSLAITFTASISIPSPPSPSCPPDQRDALSRFNNSFSISLPPSYSSSSCDTTSYPKTASWGMDKDCCSWEGVVCDNSTGNVVSLDLSCSWLQGAIDSSSSLFSLRHLQSLSLASNDMLGSTIPPEIRVFSQITHLNLSQSNISGVIPTEISHLSKLVSLDLSGNMLNMQNPTMGMLVSNLTVLEELDLSYVNMSTVTPISLMNFSSPLSSLVMLRCSLEGKFPDKIFQLPNLQNLDLSSNFNLHGGLPESNWSRNLVYLRLQSCSFDGKVPRSIGRLPRLTLLDLSGNKFISGVDFRTFSTLKNLRVLDLSGLSVSGEDATDANHLFPKLEQLFVFQSTLKNFPCVFSSMPELRELGLTRSILGEFPGKCVNDGVSFPQLQTLDMESCNLKMFPSFLSHSKKLSFLDLSANMIEEIPGWFWGIGIDTLEELYLEDNLLKGDLRLPWKRLTSLRLRNNSFEGLVPIPTSRSIREFTLSQNQFNGSISASICQLTSLVSINFGQNNLTGAIPQCLGNLTKLMDLDFSQNMLMGPLPSSLANCTSMQTLDVSHNSIDGAPPIWILKGSLTELRLQVNKFIGQWPVDIFLQSTSLQSIDLSSNKIEGPLPLPSYATKFYSVSDNDISGEIPPFMCNATNLRFLDLSYNGLTGTLPLCLKNITVSLQHLILRMNKFLGSIPDIFPEGSSLMSLDLSRNKLEGFLPRSLSNCQWLEVLDVGSNRIADSFPSWLGKLPLMVLSLRSNKFNGHVRTFEKTHPFSRIRILDLSDNSFNGNLPGDLLNLMFSTSPGDDYGYPSYLLGGDTAFMSDGYTVTPAGRDPLEFYSIMINLKGVKTEMIKINVQFTALDLSSNHFHGAIPGSIGLLKSLMGLNLSHNSFMGTIPPFVGNLTNLEWLDLSSNHLVGEIPKELVKLTSLGALDLSRNNLTGPIPSGGHFNTFPNSSFEGNPWLCGVPLTRRCDQGRTEVQPPLYQRDAADGWFSWNFVAMGFGSGIGIGISLGYITLETGKPLWLARVVNRLEAGCHKRWKRKSTKKNNRW